MTLKRYFSDSYQATFEANVTAAFEYDGKPAVSLAETYFYPASGGQPNDTGMIGTASVTDVFIREADQVIVHVLDQPLAIGAHSAEINWQRRFDHMQQHSGQHILSRAFVQLANALTIGFHLGTDSVTIDLAIDKVSADLLQKAEHLANEIIWGNRPISAYEISHEEADNLPLLKRPDVGGDKIRLVDIKEFDLNACGGTHLSATGGVGMIKIVKLERIRKSVRVGFLCGQRALRDFDQKHAILQNLTGEFTCAPSHLMTAVGKLRGELKHARKMAKQQSMALVGFEAAQLSAETKPTNELKIIVKGFANRNAGEVRHLAQALVKNQNHIALLGTSGERAQFIFGRSANVDADMVALLNWVLDKIGGSGGGSPKFAQGGGKSADPNAIQQALGEAATLLAEQLSAQMA